MTKEQFAEWQESIGPWLMDNGLKIVLIIIGAIILNKVLRKVTERAIRAAILPSNHDTEEAEKKREDTLIKIFLGVLRVTIFVIASIMILTEIGLAVGPIIAGAGIVGLAVGFGGQYLIRDIITGFFLIVENQYRVGDVVKFDNISGTVEDISIRLTTLRDMDGTVHHIPNGEIKTVSNYSKDFARINLNIGVAYDSDIEKVIEVVNKTGLAFAEDPEWKAFIIEPPKFLRVQEFADSAVVIKIIGDTVPSKQWEASGEFRKRIKIAFDDSGIEFPFPQVVMHQAE